MSDHKRCQLCLQIYEIIYMHKSLEGDWACIWCIREEQELGA